MVEQRRKADLSNLLCASVAVFIPDNQAEDRQQPIRQRFQGFLATDRHGEVQGILGPALFVGFWSLWKTKQGERTFVMFCILLPWFHGSCMFFFPHFIVSSLSSLNIKILVFLLFLFMLDHPFIPYSSLLFLVVHAFFVLVPSSLLRSWFPSPVFHCLKLVMICFDWCFFFLPFKPEKNTSFFPLSYIIK